MHTPSKKSVVTSVVTIVPTTMLAIAIGGCVRVGSPPAELTLQVEPSNPAGTYTLSGTTNLPDNTRVIVQGIRYLKAPAQDNPEGKPSNYSILAREVTTVKQGQWNANLNLWKVAANGAYREAWQLVQPSMSRGIQPVSDVTFLATIDVASQTPEMQKKLGNQTPRLEGANVRFTAEGAWYVQAQQTLAMVLPNGKTAAPPASDVSLVTLNRTKKPSVTKARPISGGAAVTQQAQTNAPLVIEQQFR